MDNKPQRVFLYILSGAIMIISLSISYYFLIVLPEQNNRKIEIAEDEFRMKKEAEDRKLEAERDEAQALELANNLKESNKEICLENATAQYSKSWDLSCEQWKKEVDREWSNCMNSSLYFETPEARKTYCKNNTSDYSKDENWTCLLPTKSSERIELKLKNMKDECNQ